MMQPIRDTEEFRKIARRVLGIGQSPKKAGVRRRIEGTMSALDPAHPNYRECERLKQFVDRVNRK
jgi:hypothetical protein